MTAQHAEQPDRDFDPGPEPAAILAALPEAYRPVFTAEYDAAVDAAHDLSRFKALRDLVQQWRLRAILYARPDYEERFLAAEQGRAQFHVPPGFEHLAR